MLTAISTGSRNSFVFTRFFFFFNLFIYNDIPSVLHKLNNLSNNQIQSYKNTTVYKIRFDDKIFFSSNTIIFTEKKNV